MVEPKPFIIIDGVHALNDTLLPLVDYGIYIDATEETQFKLRLRRELREFGYSEDKVKERWEKYWPDYLKYIDTQKQYADMVLQVDTNYKLEVKRWSGNK